MRSTLFLGLLLLTSLLLAGCFGESEEEKLIKEGTALITTAMMTRSEGKAAHDQYKEYNLSLDNWIVIAPKFINAEQKIFKPSDPIIESKAVINGQKIVFFADSHYEYKPAP